MASLGKLLQRAPRGSRRARKRRAGPKARSQTLHVPGRLGGYFFTQFAKLAVLRDFPSAYPAS